MEQGSMLYAKHCMRCAITQKPMALFSSKDAIASDSGRFKDSLVLKFEIFFSSFKTPQFSAPGQC